MEAFTDPTTKSSSETDPPLAAPPASIHRLIFHGHGGELFALFVRNLALTLVTLGLYSFWGKTKTRQYVWGQTDFAGDRFSYHGTGKELLVGWVKAIALFGGLVLTTGTLLPMLWDDPLAETIGQMLLAAGFVLLYPLAMIGSMRYRLSRTSWRGVRFSFHGHYRELISIALRSVLLTGLTLGLYFPFYQTNLRRFLTAHSRFGSASFAFDGGGRDLLGRYVLTILLTLPTLGLIWLWYLAFQRRHYWNHTTFAGARFSCTVTGTGLCGLYAVNVILLLLTLGLALPWVTVRTRWYEMDNLTLQGSLDLDHLTQQAQSVTSTGEELSGFLDIDALPG